MFILIAVSVNAQGNSSSNPVENLPFFETLTETPKGGVVVHVEFIGLAQNKPSIMVYSKTMRTASHRLYRNEPVRVISQDNITYEVVARGVNCVLMKSQVYISEEHQENIPQIEDTPQY